MTLPSILAVAGCAALLIGLLGGGVKAKEVEVPKITQRTRVISVFIGLVLIVVSLQLFATESQKAAGGAPPNPTSPSLPGPTAVVNHAPLLKSVVIREEAAKGDLVLYQEVAYSDPDGDAQVIDWILVSSTKEGEIITDGTISDPVELQQKGSTFTGEWHCTGGKYSVTIRVILSDKAGNQSAPLEYSLNCR